MQINNLQVKSNEIVKSKKDSTAFRSKKIITEVGKKFTDESLKILGAAAGAITTASIAMNKKAESEKIIEIPKAYDPIVQERLDELIEKHGKEAVALALKTQNIDITSEVCDQYKIMSMCNLFKLLSQCELEANEGNLTFLNSANNLMQRHLFYSDSKDFIPKTLIEIRPENREAFIEWLKYCNKKADEDAKPNWNNEYQINDRKDFKKNIMAFTYLPTFQEAPKEYIELFKSLRNESSWPIQEQIEVIFDNLEITPENITTAIKINKGFQDIKDDYKDYPLLSQMLILFDNENVTLEWLEKAKPIFKKVNFDIDLATNFAKIYQNEETSDERIKKVCKDIEKLSEHNLNLKREIVLEMLRCEPEKYEFYKDWLYKIDKIYTNNILDNQCHYSLSMLYYILFPQNDGYWKEIIGADKYKVAYEKLIENTEILQAIENKEIVFDEDFVIPGFEFYNQYKTKNDKTSDTDKPLLQVKLEKNHTTIPIPANVVIEQLLKNEYYDALNILANSTKEEIFKSYSIINDMISKTINNPELYITNEYNIDFSTNKNLLRAIVKNIYTAHSISIYKLVNTCDKETIDVLMRKRDNEFCEYLNVIEQFDDKQLSLLKGMINSCNIDGKPFLPTQKIDFIDLINAYKNNNIPTNKIENMIESGKIDIAQLNLDLFYKIMINMGFSNEEINSIPKEKLLSWDIKLIHKLAIEIQENSDIALIDILRAGNFEKDFLEYIHNESNIYGQTNQQTKEIFNRFKINYDKWIMPPKDMKSRFSIIDKNTERLTQVAEQIVEDMNALMQTPASSFIKKQFPKFIKGDKFIIPNEYLTSKAKLEELVEILSNTTEQGQLSQVWKRAQSNLANDNPQKKTIARNSLTILDHLEQRKKDLANIENNAIARNIDLTIRMWDRVPQKDLFQGNYSTCCIGIGNCNGSAMSHYLLNTTFNMIEIVDNSTGKIIGNALCYFAIENNKPVLIIDNIEINNSIKPSTEAGIKIREQIARYASKIAESVTGNSETALYLGVNYNDIPTEELIKKTRPISLLGETDSDDTYLDVYGGWIDKSMFSKRCELYYLK